MILPIHLLLQEFPDHIGGGRPHVGAGGLGDAGAALQADAALQEGDRTERGADEAHAHRPQEPPGVQGTDISYTWCCLITAEKRRALLFRTALTICHVSKH